MKQNDKMVRSPLFTLILMLAVGIIHSAFSLTMAAQLETGWQWTVPLFILNTAPILLAMLIIWLVTGWAWLAALLAGGLTAALTGFDYFKILFRDDPLFWTDLLLVREGVQMTGNYDVVLTPFMIIWIACVPILAACLFVCAKGKPSVRPRFFMLTAVLLVSVISFYNIYPDKALYAAMAGEYAASKNEAYKACGMMYPFFHSAGEVLKNQAVYDKNNAADIMAGYRDIDIPEERRVSLISIQLEAYADFSGYGIDGLSEEVYRQFHELQEKSYSGQLITDIFAGGTTETEWAVLTGGNQHGDFSEETDSAAWYFQRQGYTVNGAHPSHEWFYSRDVANPHLGFSEYLFMENYYNRYTDDDVCYDDVFFPDMEERLDEYFSAPHQPLFSFNVTYQGHGPYNSDKTWWGNSYCTGSYTRKSLNILNNYFHLLQDTNTYVTHLTEYLDSLDEPVVLLLYGDHKPWLGNNSSVYKELGIDLNTAQPEGFRNYYGTWYMIWANHSAKLKLDNAFVGEGPDLSPCFLMNKVFEMCGWEGSAYMQAMRESADGLPVIHTTGWYEENGELCTALSPMGQALEERFQNLSAYDREFGRVQAGES